ncbi:hypothetical protein DPMN_095633 [Dreissena polymorpha]|uniref:Uncharacterized protein n=1 Tax=Dreissena polymorpha TaxID=45954 RepID=A0A9D4R4P1_DREPO|nr:hypothetical protein DPMN_095633 [Dreissena polymorpha]
MEMSMLKQVFEILFINNGCVAEDDEDDDDDDDDDYDDYDCNDEKDDNDDDDHWLLLVSLTDSG